MSRIRTLVVASVFILLSATQVASALSISGYGGESAGVTATGEKFDGTGFTCACYPWAAMGSLVEVCYMPNDSCVTVRTNDSSGSTETFDVSQDAAQTLGIWGTVGRCFVGTNCTATVVG